MIKAAENDGWNIAPPSVRSHGTVKSRMYPAFLAGFADGKDPASELLPEPAHFAGVFGVDALWHDLSPRLGGSEGVELEIAQAPSDLIDLLLPAAIGLGAGDRIIVHPTRETVHLGAREVE